MDQKAKTKALQLIPYGLYVIGSKGSQEINGMTANWLTQVSFHPPLVAIAVEQSAHTRQLIDEGKVFTVNIMGKGPDTQPILEKFVQPQQRVGDKLGDVEFYTGLTGAPILKSAVAFLECEVREVIDTGDHRLYIGEVVEAGVHQDGPAIEIHELGWHYAG